MDVVALAIALILFALMVGGIFFISILNNGEGYSSSYSAMREEDEEVTIVLGQGELISCYQDLYENKSSTVKCTTTYMTHKQAEKVVDKIGELIK